MLRDACRSPEHQQLCEELLARLWAAHTICPSPLTDPSSPQVAERVDAAAGRWLAMLRDTSPTSRRQAATSLRRILWPAFSSPDESWWATPLGETLAEAWSP